jgi:hypothetical protein
MAKHGDDTYKMLDREDNTERNELLRSMCLVGYKDGGNWVIPYSEELWSGIKRLGTILTIRMEYQMRFAATFVFYDGLGIKIDDCAEASEEQRELFRRMSNAGTSTGTGSSEVPYTQELWDALLEEVQVDLAQHTAASQKLINAAQVRCARNLEAQTVAECEKAVLEKEAMQAALERAQKQALNLMRPCMTFRPALLQEDDGAWVAIYGALRATGPTPETAHQEFDRQWVGKDEI